MKAYLSLFLFLFSAINLLSQGYYPLQKGNIWQYWNNDPWNSHTWKSEIIGDTTLPNGKNYFLSTGFGLGTNFLRQEGSKVFGYDGEYSSEYVLFDFTANVDDTISIYHNQSRAIILKAVYENEAKKRWLFVEYWGDSSYSFDFYNWTITDSMGLTSLIIEPGSTYHLTAAVINGDTIGTITGVKETDNLLPGKIVLMQNYPNPFNPITTFKFILPSADNVELKIFNLLGKEIALLASKYFSGGEHQIEWDASSLSGGIYFYRLNTSDYSKTKKLILLK